MSYRVEISGKVLYRTDSGVIDLLPLTRTQMRPYRAGIRWRAGSVACGWRSCVKNRSCCCAKALTTCGIKRWPHVGGQASIR